jgi:ribonuclease HI
VAIQVLGNFQINVKKLVWECHQSLTKLAEHDTVELVWTPVHVGVDGNEIADQSARQGSSHPCVGPEPACGISTNVAAGVIRCWVGGKREEHWQSSWTEAGCGLA